MAAPLEALSRSRPASEKRSSRSLSPLRRLSIPLTCTADRRSAWSGVCAAASAASPGCRRRDRRLDRDGAHRAARRPARGRAARWDARRPRRGSTPSSVGRRAGQAAAPQHPARAGGGRIDEPVELRRLERHRLGGAARLAQDGGAQPRLQLLAPVQDDPLGGGLLGVRAHPCDELRDPAQEARGLAAEHDPVIAGQRERELVPGTTAPSRSTGTARMAPAVRIAAWDGLHQAGGAVDAVLAQVLER